MSSNKRIPRNRVTEKTLFDKRGLPRLGLLKNHMKMEGRLTEGCALRIIRETTRMMEDEPTLMEVPVPVLIVGDIHGQYYDLLKLLSIGGSASVNRYLFLGDYVDRGMFSIECVLLLYAMKIAYPKHVLLLRGNHESRHLTKIFTFKDECLVKYTHNVYKACMESFDALPLAAIVNRQFFCVHGGLSPEIRDVSEVGRINRFREPNRKGDSMMDLLWSDPMKDYGEEKISEMFIPNKARQISYHFSYKAVCNFLNHNGLISIVRGHEAQDAGFKMYKPMPKSKFPSLITIFSAPNYCETYGNKAVIMCYEKKNMNLKTFLCQSHPYWLPNFQNGLVWSLPFAARMITQLLFALCSVCTEEELSRISEMDDSLLNKVKAVGKMARYYDKMASDNKLAVRMKGLGDNEQLRKDILMGKEKSSEAKKVKAGEAKNLRFDEAKKLDSDNETFNPTDDTSYGSYSGTQRSTGGASGKRKTRSHRSNRSTSPKSKSAGPRSNSNVSTAATSSRSVTPSPRSARSQISASHYSRSR
ncbi:protein phosphatase 3 catalytic subunit alpha-like [Convolutriloba macropyga]|uniref:protein phosphatase 3 catalytic subunit alpha-like n=1 Tax=Convolutriloba macropyga TaxID=536237 RepID=UPI003F522EB7